MNDTINNMWEKYRAIIKPLVDNLNPLEDFDKIFEACRVYRVCLKLDDKNKYYLHSSLCRVNLETNNELLAKKAAATFIKLWADGMNQCEAKEQALLIIQSS